MPLLIDAENPGKEILHPVAVTIFGGLITATLLDAFVTPLLLLAFGRNAVERLRQGNAGEPAGTALKQSY
jgi:HME family heavy-metal exporter